MVTISSISELDCTLSPQLLKKFNAKKDDFQMLPPAAARALELVRDPSCDLALVAKTIEKDLKLSSGILSVANCPIYSPGRPVVSVREAIIHVGFRQCQTLIQACCAKSLMRTIPIDPHVGESVLQHCLATASLANSMNTVLDLGFQGEEFTAGLLHDLGRLLLGTMYPELSQQLQQVQLLETPESLAMETEIAGGDHARVGCFFAISNRLPIDLMEAIRFHQTPELSSSRLTATIAVADQISLHFLDVEPDEYDVSVVPGIGAFEKNCGADARDNLESNIGQVLELGKKTFASLSSSNH